MSPYEIQVEQKGPTNIVLILAMVAAVVLSFAIWTIAAQVGAAILAIGVGLGIRNALVGVAYVIEARGKATAKVLRAENQTPRLVDGRGYLLED